MPRYKFTIEYDGTSFSGWQRQENAPSIQESIENLFPIFAKETIRLHVAGRTDAGVHAKGQVAHCDLETYWNPFRLMMALNFHLKPAPIRILNCEIVDDNFHARFSAKSRSYLYRILNRQASPALDLNRVWHIPQPLCHESMSEASKFLVGHHDFSTFRARSCQSTSPLRHLTTLTIRKIEDEVHFFLKAPSFLHHQVRNIVGTLSLVGTGKWTIQDFKEAFLAKNREKGGPTAPPQGLYFMKVEYH